MCPPKYFNHEGIGFLPFEPAHMIASDASKTRECSWFQLWLTVSTITKWDFCNKLEGGVDLKIEIIPHNLRNNGDCPHFPFPHFPPFAISV